MKCCEKCFISPYLVEIIKSKSISVGKCESCGFDDVKLYDLTELGDIFRLLLDLYTIVPENVDGSATINKALLLDFPGKIFSTNDEAIVKKILRAVFLEDGDYIDRLLSNHVLLDWKITNDFDNYPTTLSISWDSLSEEIKHQNRFHLSNIKDLGKIQELLNYSNKILKKGTKYFRARISGRDGYTIMDMKNPPHDDAVAGRANPRGISYLYLATNDETTLYEVRASLYDYVTVADFELKEDINIISLCNTESYDPLYLAETEVLKDFIIYLPFIKKLEMELSKPLRRDDKPEIDYLPTQYLSEFIKSLGYDGIEYKSSLIMNGINLVIFNPEKFEVIDRKVKEILNIKFTSNVIS